MLSTEQHINKCQGLCYSTSTFSHLEQRNFRIQRKSLLDRKVNAQGITKGGGIVGGDQPAAVAKHVFVYQNGTCCLVTANADCSPPPDSYTSQQTNSTSKREMNHAAPSNRDQPVAVAKNVFVYQRHFAASSQQTLIARHLRMPTHDSKLARHQNVR